MRLNAFLARAGIASRRGAEELIRAGRVRVNGDGETACGAGAVDFLDQQPQVQEISDSKFTLKRLADGATCADVRAASF